MSTTRWHLQHRQRQHLRHHLDHQQHGGITTFFGSNTAGTATITNESGGGTIFQELKHRRQRQDHQSLAGQQSSAASLAAVPIPARRAMRPSTTTMAGRSSRRIPMPAPLTSPIAMAAARSSPISRRPRRRLSPPTTAVLPSSAHPFGTDTVDGRQRQDHHQQRRRDRFQRVLHRGQCDHHDQQRRPDAFFDNSTGDKAQFIVNGTGYVDFSESSGPAGDGRIKAGSIAGDGLIYIGGGSTGRPTTRWWWAATISRPRSAASSPITIPAAAPPGPAISRRRHRHADPVRHQHLYRHHRRQRRLLAGRRFDRLFERRHGESRRHVERRRFRQRHHGRGGGTFAPGSGAAGSFMTVSSNLAFQSGAL